MIEIAEIRLIETGMNKKAGKENERMKTNDALLIYNNTPKTAYFLIVN